MCTTCARLQHVCVTAYPGTLFLVQHGGKVVDMLLVLGLVGTQRIQLTEQAVHLCTQAAVGGVRSIEGSLQVVQPDDGCYLRWFAMRTHLESRAPCDIGGIKVCGSRFHRLVPRIRMMDGYYDPGVDGCAFHMPMLVCISDCRGV